MSSSLVAAPSVVLPCRGTRSRLAPPRRATAPAAAEFRILRRANVVVRAAEDADGPTWVGEEPTGGNGSEEMANQDGALGQGLTLVHFSAQVEACLSHKTTLHTLNTS
jgi:hypothetical protein